MNYHIPVMAAACIDFLNIQPEGTYVDVTLGGGGHSRLILEKLGAKGRLVVFDQDEDAAQNVPADERVLFAPANFRHLKRYLRLFGIRSIDGLLADLGVSSHQFDEGERGFSYRFDAPLDMRMDQSQELTAAGVLANRDAAALQRMFSDYGELRNARTLALQLTAQQKARPIATIGDLLAAIEPVIKGPRQRYLAQVFQALRIEVNDEMGALTDMLVQATEVLAAEGRLVVLSYHSLEDRLVKNVMKTGNAAGVLQQDFFGNTYRPYELITKKPLLPDAPEIKMNPRAHSAKLRVAERRAPA
jgi:16S rRNA (cytosine1402-N4)-methyltransferase